MQGKFIFRTSILQSTSVISDPCKFPDLLKFEVLYLGSTIPVHTHIQGLVCKGTHKSSVSFVVHPSSFTTHANYAVQCL